MKGNSPLLVVSRKVGERILIGEQITITVVKVGSGGVRIGVEAPKEMPVVREELAEQIRKEQGVALRATPHSEGERGNDSVARPASP